MSLWGKIKGWTQKNVFNPINKGWEQNVKKPIQTAGGSISNATKPVTNAVGLTTAHIPDSKQVKLDPQKVKAMGNYGDQIAQTAGTFNPKNYGEGYYKTRTFNPNVPQTRALPRTPQMSTVNSGGNALHNGQVYQPQAIQPQARITPQYLPTPRMSQPMNGQIQSQPTPPQPTAQQMAGYQPNPYLQTPNIQQAPTANAQAVNAPHLMNSPSQSIVRNIDPNTLQNTQAVNLEMRRMQDPLQLQQGFGNDYVNNSVNLATRRLDAQAKKQAQNLKEMQSKSGNLHSSVAQKQLADLMAEYDARKMDAIDKANLRQAEASREDRYRNLGAENTRANEVANLANAGYGMGMGQANFTRQGRQIDNAMLQNQAAFNNNVAQQNFNNNSSVNTTNYNRGMEMANFNNDVGQQDFNNRNQIYGQDWNRGMAEARFNQGANQQNFANQMALYNAGINADRYNTQLLNEAQRFNIGQADAADVRNMGNYQNMLNNQAAYAGNQINPQSQLDNARYLQDQANRQAKFNAMLNLGGKFIK